MSGVPELRSFLKDAGGARLLRRIRRPVDLYEELGALCAQSDRPGGLDLMVALTAGAPGT